MKVRLLTVAAIAAVAMGAQATAQQGDLERALADLNSGIVAPTMGGASASGSTGLDISGDTRARSTDINNDINDQIIALGGEDPGIPGNATDVRVRVNMNFSVNEATSAFVQWTGGEVWGFGDDARDSGISQAHFSSSDLLGTGGNWKIGRSYETVGSGRILGSEDWDLSPTSWSGMSYSNNFGGVDIGIQNMNSNEDDGNGYWVITAGFDLGNETATGIDFNHITEEDGEGTWWEASTGGAISMFNWSATLADSDDGTNSGGASAFSIGMNMSDWTGGFIGNLSYEMTDSDAEFRTIDGAYHGQTGITDALGEVWGFGELTGVDRSTTQIHIDLNVMEGWDTSFSMIDVEDGPVDSDEMNFTIGKDLGNGINAWIGYGDGSIFDVVDYTVYYVQLSLAF